MADTGYPHIVRDDQGWLRVNETGVPLVRIIAEHVYGNATVEQLTRLCPPLTRGQAHAVLAYYYDHQPAIEEELRAYEHRRLQVMHEIVSGDGPSPSQSAPTPSPDTSPHQPG
jgi:uncharacterized protein (DUF433 family)